MSGTLPQQDKYLVGVISDTHGLMRPEALKALAGADLILHAGDIGRPEVIDALRTIAPVVAVRGNNDREAWAKAFAETEIVKIGEVNLYLLHALQELALDPSASGFDIIVSGHSHRPSSERRADGVLYLNPGSAGPRRFKLPVSVALLTVRGKRCRARLVELDV
jgi:putative phosphoesterase